MHLVIHIFTLIFYIFSLFLLRNMYKHVGTKANYFAFLVAISLLIVLEVLSLFAGAHWHTSLSNYYPFITSFLVLSGIYLFRQMLNKKVKVEDKLLSANNEIRQQISVFQSQAIEIELIQKELRDAKNRYKQLIDESPIAIGVHQAGQIVLINKFAIRILGGNSESDFIGKSVLEFVHHDYLEFVKGRMQSLYSGDEIFSEAAQEKLITLKGEVIDAEVAISKIFDNGKPANQLVFQDITDRKKAEEELTLYRLNLEDKVKERAEEVLRINEVLKTTNEEIEATNEELYAKNELLSREVNERMQAEVALKQSESKFRTLFEHISDALIITSSSKIIETNHEALNLLEYNKEEILEKSIHEIFTEANFFIPETSGYNKSIIFEARIKTKNNILIPVEVNLTNIDFDGSRGIISVIRDITERKKVEEELNKYRQHLETIVAERTQQLETALKRAEDSDRLKSAFLANISHEIRTPMNGILGFSELLKERHMTDDVRYKYLNVITESTRQLLAIVTDIVEASKLQASQVKIEYSEVDLIQLIDESRDYVTERLQNTERMNIRVFTNIDTNTPIRKIATDREKLMTILKHLLSNASKFTFDGSITIGYKIQKGENVIFYVRDTGIGITQEKLPIIFQRFRQGDESATRKFGGTGLGLTISYGYAELLGGKLSVVSEPNVGSEFILSLPIEEEKQSGYSSSGPSRLSTSFNWKTKKILVVEDDQLNYYFIYELLKPTQVKLDHAINGQLAVDMALSNKYDIVLMDIQLPIKNGLEATRELRNKGFDKPIIALTANAMENDVKRVKDYGCNDYMAKPLSEKQLMHMIDFYLNPNNDIMIS